MKISDALKGVQRLGVETAPYIYYVENHPVYADKVDSILQIAEEALLPIYTSVIALTETLMKPLQAQDQPLISAYRSLLTSTTGIHLVPITALVADRAAQLRAQYNLRTPDALHVASALDAGCDAFLTNDRGLKRVTELQVFVLDELQLDLPHTP